MCSPNGRAKWPQRAQPIALVRRVRVEVVDVVSPAPPRAGRERVCAPHPLAREAYDRSLFLEAHVGTMLALRAPTWVCWASVPAAVALVIDVRLPRDSFARALRLGLSTEPDEVRDG